MSFVTLVGPQTTPSPSWEQDGVHFLADKMLKRQGVIMTLLGGSVMELVESTLALEPDSLGSSLASVPYHLCDDR